VVLCPCHHSCCGNSEIGGSLFCWPGQKWDTASKITRARKGWRCGSGSRACLVGMTLSSNSSTDQKKKNRHTRTGGRGSSVVACMMGFDLQHYKNKQSPKELS
jgi:hypothetical protein